MDTVCSLEVENDGLYEAMERLADMFKKPLFLDEYIDGEINSLHEDFEHISGNPDSRFDRIIDHVSNFESYAQRFWHGNQETIRHSQIREAVVNFYKQYYSANQMFAVVLGNSSMKELKEKAVEIYSQIPNRKRPTLTYINRPLPYQPNNMKKVIKVVPLENKHTLSIFFALPYCRLDDSDHLKYIQALFNYRGAHSLHDCLTRRNLISRIDTDVQRFGDGQVL